MNYIKISINVANLPEYKADVLTFELGEIGFSTFETENDTLIAYAKQTDFSAESLKQMAEDNDLSSDDYSVEEVEDKDWNEEWEKNYFQPIVVDGGESKCVIHSSFHTDVPEAEYDIVINPKMSFGTGHHETTSSMLRWILSDSMQGKKVLDMGCGTAVLGILAKMRGADYVMGVDIDEWCKENATESAAINNIDMEIKLGDASILPKENTFDVILANINRNILLADMDKYVACLNNGGNLYMSGFYTEDIPVIKEKAESLGLKYEDFKEKNNWVAVKFLK
jgi:ribosomal protein L11 methyltransferase